MIHIAWVGVLLASDPASRDEEAIQKVEIGPRREVRVNGKPFFPVMSWAQEPSRYPFLRRLGFNSFAGESKGAKVCADAAREAGGYLLARFDSSIAGHPALLCWRQPDEPDLDFDKGKPKQSAESVVDAYRKIRAQDPTRPVFLNYTGHFMESAPWSKKRSPEERKAYYGAASEGGDILGFDVYPIYGWNREDGLIWVAEGVSDLLKYAGPRKPIFVWIETSKGSRWVTYERQKDVLPEHTRAEVWMAIIRGATGIGYFTHAWRPRFTEFAPTEAMQQELKRLNEQIARLAPAILAEPARQRVEISITDGIRGEILAREHEGHLYLFANNLDMGGRRGRATIRVDGLRKGTKVEVLDEAREISAENGQFTDDFDRLAVHLYRLRM